MFYTLTKYLLFGFLFSGSLLAVLAGAIGARSVVDHLLLLIVMSVLGSLAGLHIVIFSGRHRDDYFRWIEKARYRYKGFWREFATLGSYGQSPASYRVVVVICGLGALFISLLSLIFAIARLWPGLRDLLESLGIRFVS